MQSHFQPFTARIFLASKNLFLRVMEQYQQTATGTTRHALQLPEDDPDNTTVNLILEDEDDPGHSLMIGDLIRRERHADVYSVYDPETGAKESRAEARAFVIDRVSGKLKKYRKRYTYRLGARKWLSAPCSGAKVIIYTTSSPDVATAKEETPGLSEFSHRLPSGSNDSSTHSEGQQDEGDQTQNTDYKRESRRTRQLERRRAKSHQGRTEKNLEGVPSCQSTEPIGNERPVNEPVLSSREIAFRLAILQYLLYDDKGKLRSAWPSASSDHDTCIRLMRVRTLSLLTFYDRIESKIKQVDQGFPLPFRYFGYGILGYLEELQKELSEMTYSQLFSGIHSALSAFTTSDLSLVKTTNHRLAILVYIQSTLPLIISDKQKAKEEDELLL
ncbi:hypothetical protein FocnCong_v003544 [Fusarium oxysporum f. sp. conglutinans]|nr:hypothetical protein FocnCong_v003544 [Fusarium oxysporum f. sp. conglutinans]